MHPTLSSTVHYFRYPGAEAQAAIVAHVNDDGTFNLAVFDHNGTPEPRPACVPFLGYGISIAAGHYCRDPLEAPEALGTADSNEVQRSALGTSTGLQQGEVGFHNENTGFGGVFTPPVPVLTEVVGGGGAFDGGGASGDWARDDDKYAGGDSAEVKTVTLAPAPNFGSSLNSSYDSGSSSSSSSSDSSSSSSDSSSSSSSDSGSSGSSD